MKLKTTVFIFLLLCQVQVFGWQQTSDILVGQSHQVASEVFGAERTLMISLPQGYEEGNEGYPVLYVLDGQNWFLTAVSQRQMLRAYDYVPPFIVVGIQTVDQPRYGFFNNAEKLQSYLEKEVIPYIKERYTTSSQRMVLGWQFASAFLIQTLAQKPQLFDGWFAASPFPIQGSKLNMVKKSLEEGSLTSGTVVFATSLNENSVEGGAQELAGILEAQAPNTLRWEYAKLKHETIVSAGHRSTPMGTLYAGLRTYFEDYPVLEFNDLASYKAAGGFEYVEHYYQNRSETYGFPGGIPEEGMFFLVRMCLDADAIEDFDFFVQKFKSTPLFEGLNLGWNMRYADFYLTNEKHLNALEQYEIIAEIFPENARPIHGMARAYQAAGDSAKALAHYEKAVAMAEKANDRSLSRYQDDLKKFKEGK